MIYDTISNELKSINKRIENVQAELLQLPPGKIVVAKNGSNFKWYLNNGHQTTYLPKTMRPLAEQLACKKYLNTQLASLLRQKTALEHYIQNCNNAPDSDQFLSDDSPYQELLRPYFHSLSETIEEWVNAPFEQNQKYPEQLNQKSISGNVVRSKSESIIDMALYMNKIPFRYECLLKLNEISFYPDFTILHPRTGQIFYWEHFGMMDDPGYAENAYSKMQFYNSCGIIPSINLITTFETKDHPLTSDLVEKTIKQYFGG